jgi:hypothetical protein
VAQQPRVEIVPASIGIDHGAGIVLGHCIDREIAAAQIVFEFHVRREFGRESAIAGAGLALEARERVLFLGFRVQENGKIPPDGNESRPLELGRRRAHDDPIALMDRAAQQTVTNRATHQVHLHGAHGNESSHPDFGSHRVRPVRLRHGVCRAGRERPVPDPQPAPADRSRHRGSDVRPRPAAPAGDGPRGARVRLRRARVA